MDEDDEGGDGVPPPESPVHVKATYEASVGEQPAAPEPRRPPTTLPVQRTVIWQHAPDMRSATTMDRQKFDDWSDEREGWRAIAGVGSADVSIVEQEAKYRAWMWKQLTEIEAVSVSKGFTRPGRIFREFQNYVNFRPAAIRRNVAMLAFVRTQQEKLGLGHTTEEKSAKVQPGLRALLGSLNFVDPGRRLAPSQLESELTVADFSCMIRDRCVSQDRDAWIMFDSGVGAQAVGEGRSWTMIVCAALGDPNFDIRHDIAYGYDIGRYLRFSEEIIDGRVPPGSWRMVDEVDSMFAGREHEQRRHKVAMRQLHRNRKYNVVQGGSGNFIFETHWYIRHIRCTHRAEHRKRGVVRIAEGAVGEIDDKEYKFGHPWASKFFYVPGPDECGLKDVYYGLYKACCRLTDRELPGDDEIDEMFRKHERIESPLDVALKDPAWGLEHLEDRASPGRRIAEAVLTTLREKDLLPPPPPRPSPLAPFVRPAPAERDFPKLSPLASYLSPRPPDGGGGP